MTTEAQQLLIELHTRGNFKRKGIIMQAFPELFTPFKNGEWIKKFGEDIIIRITDFEKAFGYGFCEGIWTKDTDWSFINHPHHWQRVKEDEVISAFVKEFKKRGFKEGVKFKDPKCGTVREFTRLAFGVFFYLKNIKKYGQQIYSNGHIVYKDGVFAEIVEKPKTIEQRLEIVEKFINELKNK